MPGKPEPPHQNRAVIVTGLDRTVTVAEVLQAIASTAPVGAVSSAYLLPRRHLDEPHRVLNRPGGPEAGAAAKISFNQRAAAMELVRLSRAKIFRVRGRTPYVTEDREGIQLRGPIPPPLSESASQTRVLLLEGPAEGVEGFDEVSIRRLLKTDLAASRDAGPFRDMSEPVITTLTDEGRQRMEWRFFSYSRQALPFKRVIKRHFGSRLKVSHGRDPCCSVHISEGARVRYYETKRLSLKKDGDGGELGQEEQRAGEAPIEDSGRTIEPAGEDSEVTQETAVEPNTDIAIDGDREHIDSSGPQVMAQKPVDAREEL